MQIAIVCVPFQNDMARWGFARGPQAYLDAGLIERLRAAGHTVAEPVWIDFPREERTRDTVTNLGRIAARTAAAVHAALDGGADLVVALEGDCTHSVGAMGGLARALGGSSPGVAWYDAHGDTNTFATTESGMLGGMPYAVALGWDLDDWREAAGLDLPVHPEAAALLGSSDLDPAEEEALARHPIAHLRASDLAEDAAAERTTAALAPRAAEAPVWYIHVDLDVAGPEITPGALTPAPTWPSRAALLASAGAAARALPVRVVGLAAYQPGGDSERRGARFALDMLDAVLEGTRERLA
jgi:arginase